MCVCVCMLAKTFYVNILMLFPSLFLSILIVLYSLCFVNDRFSFIS